MAGYRMIFGMLAVLAVGELSASTDAVARGGGSNFMNSPGYQRRLQESRGYVTNQSGSVVTKPIVVAPYHRAERRSRRR